MSGNRISLVRDSGKCSKAFSLIIPDMPCTKRVYKDKNASVHWSASKNEKRSRSRWSTAYQPRINRGSIASQPLIFSRIDWHRISFVRASGETSRTVLPIRWRARGRAVSWPGRTTTSFRTKLRSPSLPRCAPPRPDRPVVGPGFGFDKFRKYNSFFFYLGEMFCSNLLRRYAVRPDVTLSFFYMRMFNSTGLFFKKRR